MYRVGFPGWKLDARFGVPLLVRVETLHDAEAGVVVIRSPDLRGLVVEMPDSATARELMREINDCVDVLMTEALRAPPKARTVTAWSGEFQST